jgi:hypothetical protein
MAVCAVVLASMGCKNCSSCGGSCASCGQSTWGGMASKSSKPMGTMTAQPSGQAMPSTQPNQVAFPQQGAVIGAQPMSGGMTR